MRTRQILIPAAVVLLCVAIVALSAWAAPALARGPRPFRAMPPLFWPGWLPFERFGGFSPFGRHLAGWRGLASAAASFGFVYLTALLTVLLFPRPLRRVRDGFGQGAGGLFRLFGIGALGGLALLALIALGFFTFAAFPLPLVLVAGLLLVTWEGLVALAAAIGRGIARWAAFPAPSPVLELALGTLVIFAPGRIFYVGWVVVLLFSILALGAALATRFGSGEPWSAAGFEGTEEALP